MIRTFSAALRLMFVACLCAGLAQPAAARVTREEKQAAKLLAERAEVAVAEVKARRARGERVWCVPFARTLRGLALRGNAKTWWAAAEGLYRRGATPRVGAVMVFSGSKKMPMGHVAVVAEVVSEREILIDHANWKRNQISLGMRVVDVSHAGDWSAVKVEGSPGVLGRVNPVSGFIYPGEMVASN
jgi:hypothetical protein